MALPNVYIGTNKFNDQNVSSHDLLKSYRVVSYNVKCNVAVT